MSKSTVPKVASICTNDEKTIPDTKTMTRSLRARNQRIDKKNYAGAPNVFSPRCYRPVLIRTAHLPPPTRHSHGASSPYRLHLTVSIDRSKQPRHILHVQTGNVHPKWAVMVGPRATSYRGRTVCDSWRARCDDGAMTTTGVPLHRVMWDRPTRDGPRTICACWTADAETETAVVLVRNMTSTMTVSTTAARWTTIGMSAAAAAAAAASCLRR